MFLLRSHMQVWVLISFLSNLGFCLCMFSTVNCACRVVNIHVRFLLSYKVFSITSLLMALPQLFSLSCKSYWTFFFGGVIAFNGGRYKILLFFQERLYWGPYCSRGKREQQVPLLTGGELIPYTGWGVCSGVRLEKWFRWFAHPLSGAIYSRPCTVPCFCSQSPAIGPGSSKWQFFSLISF